MLIGCRSCYHLKYGESNLLRLFRRPCKGVTCFTKSSRVDNKVPSTIVAGTIHHEVNGAMYTNDVPPALHILHLLGCQNTATLSTYTS